MKAWVPASIRLAFGLAACLVLASSLPSRAQPAPVISDIRLDSTGRPVIRVAHEPESYFILYRGDEVAAIDTITALELLPDPGPPPEVELVDQQPILSVDARFYRVEQVPLAAPKDSDGDGMNDVYELGYRPLLDPLYAADALTDPDGDGRTTLEEYRGGTHPFFPDPPPPPATPVIAGLPSATRGTFLELTGTGPINTYIRVEGAAAIATNAVSIDGSFTVPLALLPNRLNRLFVSAVNADGVTSAGRPLEILQDSQPPTLFIDFPTNGMTLATTPTMVAGRVGDGLSGYAGLFVWVHSSPSEGEPPLASTTFPTNSPLRATVDVGIGPNGTYERGDVPLAVGTNLVSVVATDALGNRALRQAQVIRRELEGPRLLAISGDRQMTNAVRRLPEPLVVRVTQPDGAPVADAPLVFDITRSNGRLLPADTNLLLADWTLEPNADTNGAMRLSLKTDTAGEARVWWTLGSDAGCANNRVCVTSLTASNGVFFCASALPHPARQLNIGSGNNQKVETGGLSPEPLRVWASDGLNPGIAVPVTFRVVQGGGLLIPGGRDSPPPSDGGGAGGEGVSELTVATGRTGHASVGFIAGPDAGQNVIEATFPGQFGLPATFIVYGVARDADQPGAFTGLVLDNTSCPIGGAVVVLKVANFDQPTTSDAQGRFRFDNVPGGMGHLYVNGRTATTLFTNTIPPNSFPSLAYSVVTVANADNSLPTPVLLPRLNPANAVTYYGTNDLVLTCAGIEGLKFTIQANSMTDEKGNRVTAANPVVVSLDQVHHDNVPMPMPDGVAPPFAWTFQPGGAHFNPLYPVKVEYPNMSGLAPGSIAYFLSFNHDTERFEIVASGSVTPDGSTIVTDPGSGITISGWGCNCPPYSVTGECRPCLVIKGPRHLLAGEKLSAPPVQLTVNRGPATWEVFSGEALVTLTQTGPLTATLVPKSAASAGQVVIRARATREPEGEPCEAFYTVDVRLVEIATEAFAKVPAQRKRSRFGVGESIRCSLDPAGIVFMSVDWKLEGGSPVGSRIVAWEDNTATLTAGTRKATELILATFEYGGQVYRLRKEIELVEPEYETAVKFWEDIIPSGRLGVGMYIQITVHPTDVSFFGVNVWEISGPPSNLDGWFLEVGAPFHKAGSVKPLNEHNHQDDQVFFMDGNPVSDGWRYGAFEWDIPVRWRVGDNGPEGTLPNRLQRVVVHDETGRATVTKLGVSATRTP